MSSSNNRTFKQKHGLMIGVGVVVLTVIIVLIVMFIKNGEEGNLGSGPSEPGPSESGPSAYDLSPAAQDGANFLQDTDQSDIDGGMGTDLPEEEEPPASGVETYMIVPGNKPPLDYTRITSSSSW